MNRSKCFGKIKKKLEEAKNRWARITKVEFSHNESARLATDALLDGGLEAYQKVLNDEGEVDFLSEEEVKYIKANAKEPYYANDFLSDGDSEPVSNGNHSDESECFYPMNSDNSESKTRLHNWSSEDKPYLKDKSSATVYFQTDKSNNIRESIRRCIHKTTQVLAIMMDEFTDAEIFCDVLEAANKRNIFVYLLLEATKVHLFIKMCEKLQVKDVHLKNVCVRSVSGEVYCAKSGKKFYGQICEKFIISDWRCVLSGTYSFTWLSGQVHRNFLSKFSGHVVELFDEEFRHLYSSSKPVMGLKTPAPMAPVLKQQNSISMMSDSSSAISPNTTSEKLSGSSATSISHVSLRPSSPINIPPPLQQFSSSTNIAPPVRQSSSPTNIPPPDRQSSSPTNIPPLVRQSSSPTNTPPAQTSLHRMNSFHNYSSYRTPTSPTNYQPTYYQRNHVQETPTFLYNKNANIYRSLRERREDFTTSRFTQSWRLFT
ncbi:FAM83A [Pelobates cultripes]|uniref:FAM83A n=1 Tax=Pelobates cultripes TaxID=61616 RepID=A0AAD1S3V3_PELCU|nr:FAM83A [Pelobates cultripes]